MKRNKEQIQHFVSCVFIVGAMSLLCYRISAWAAVVCLVGGILIIGITYYYEHRRYQKINELSMYLHQICAGNHSLDIRDNEEGELSILKNEIYKVTRRLSEQSELLRKDKRYLADALSDISHQLKTPLTSMSMIMDLLKRQDLEEERRLEFIRSVSRQLERIEWLVTSLLKLSKIDAGTVLFKKEQVNVATLIKQALEPLSIKAEVKEQSIIINGYEGWQKVEAVNFIGDKNWSLEALINILKNCIEHTPAGGRLEIAFTENTLYTEIMIKDNGEGIDQEDLPHIFERFYRGKNASSESVGIGLAMARSIILKQNGDITVKSEKGMGTTFRIRFYKGII